jgi:DNA-directed RNA polymerase subunit K/omega
MPSEAVKTNEPNLNQLILDRSKDKYRLVLLSLRWAQEIKQREQSADTPQEILNRALKEILTGQVSLEEVEKLAPLPKPEPKAPEAVPKPAAEKNGADDKK